MTARDLLSQLLEQFPPPPPVFALSLDTYQLLQSQITERNDRAVRWAAGLEAAGAHIVIDPAIPFGQIVKRRSGQ